MHVLAAELRAAAQRRKYLAGVEAHLGIERVLDAVLHFQVRGAELVRHQIALLDADAVLAREHAADVDAELQYRLTESFRAVELARHVRIVED